MKRAKRVQKYPDAISGAQLGNPKMNLTNKVQDAMRENTVNFLDLTKIFRSTLLNTRERDEIYVTSVNFRFQMRTLLNHPETMPVYITWAIVQLKNRRTATPLDVAELKTDMFRAAGTLRNISFDAVLNGAQKRNAPLNTDKFNVLSRGEYQIAPLGLYSEGVPSFVNRAYQCMVNKKVVYDGGSNEDASNPIIFLYWCTRLNTNATAIGSTDELSHSVTCLTHFRDMV